MESRLRGGFLMMSLLGSGCFTGFKLAGVQPLVAAVAILMLYICIYIYIYMYVYVYVYVYILSQIHV